MKKGHAWGTEESILAVEQNGAGKVQHILKGVVHPKMKILLSLSHSYVVSYMYDLLSSLELRRIYFVECWEPNISAFCIEQKKKKENKTKLRTCLHLDLKSP